MEDKALRFLGLARRARLLEVGEEPVGIACRAGHARLLLIAQDAADHTFRRARSFCRSGKPPYICAPFSKEALGSALGCNSCALCAFTDAPMALAFLQALDAPEKYEAILTELSARPTASSSAGRKKRRIGTMSNMESNHRRWLYGNQI